MNKEAKNWYQSSLEDFHAGHYKEAKQKAKKCIPLLTELLTEEEFNWLRRIHNYNLHYDLANNLFERRCFNDALIYYASLDFNGASELILERLKMCRSKAIYPLLENTTGFNNQSLCSKEQLIPFEQDGEWGYINKRNEIIIPIQFDYARAFSEGLAVVRIKDKFGIIDLEGHQIIPFKYDYINSIQMGMIHVEQNDKEFIINDKDIIIYVL